MPNKAVRHVAPRHKTTYDHRFPHKLSSTQYFPEHAEPFSTSIIAEQEKTGNKFYALLISPLLPKVFLIDSRALALLKYAQTFSTQPLII